MTAKEKFLSSKSFSVYYGKGCVKELAKFDIAIIEPLAQDVGTIIAMQKEGILVFAYISVMEVHPEQAEFNLHKNDLLKIEGESVQNKEFHTFYTDLRCEKWMMNLYRKVEIYLTEYGCDGLFLDTMSNLEDARIPVNTKYLLIESAVAFLEKIKKDFNQPLLIQNNGTGLLIHYTKGSIDGVCWENPSIRLGITGRVNKVITKKLNDLRTEINMKIFILTEESGQKSKIIRYAKRNNYLYYDAPKNYLQI